jgi:AmmeMemoRadiSam system protein B
MQIPFLRLLVADLRIVPILMGSQTREEVEVAAEAIAAAVASRTDVVLVASSDLSHYHPAPVANALDAKVVGDVERFDPETLMVRLEESHEHACGGGPMVAVMMAARKLGATQATSLRYADSGDVPPNDKSRVVGYLAAALTAAA